MSEVNSKEEFYKQEVFDLLSPMFSDQFDDHEMNVVMQMFLGSKMDHKELVNRILCRDEN